MGAAAGLEIDALDLEHAHAALAARGLHAHAAHEAGVGVELVLADPAVPHGVRLGDELREPGIQRILVERLVHVEVEPGVGGGDRAAVDRVRHERAQQVRGGVEAHVRSAARHVDPRLDRGARHEGRAHGLVGPGGGHVQDGAGVLGVLARVGDRQTDAVGGQEHPGIAGLATAERVEHGAVEHDA